MGKQIQPKKIYIVVGADMHNKEITFLAMDANKETAEAVGLQRLNHSELLKQKNADIQHVYTLEMIDSIDATKESFNQLESWLVDTVKLTVPQACTAIAVFGAKFLNVYEEISNELVD